MHTNGIILFTGSRICDGYSCQKIKCLCIYSYHFKTKVHRFASKERNDDMTFMINESMAFITNEYIALKNDLYDK